MAPLVSIIIPSYNCEAFILETLQSISLQTYQNWECIIVDDGSTDSTIRVISDYISNNSKFNLLERPNHKAKGANACRNYGLKKSKGEYLIFFDSDDLFTPYCIENRVKQIQNSTYDMLVFSMGVFKNVNDLIIPPNRVVFNNTLDKTLEAFITEKKIPWSTSRPIYKTSLIKNNKIWFNENLQRFQDVEFNIKVIKICKPKYKSIDEIDMYYRLDNSKYSDKKFILKLFPSLYTFYKSILGLLAIEEKKVFRGGLYIKLFFFIKEYFKPYVPLKDINKTVKLFSKALNLSFKEKALLKVIIYLNKYYLENKGYDRICIYLKKQVYKIE